eukprot:gene11245-15089_t
MEYSDYPNLSSPLLGAKILFATDEWFAATENVIKDNDPIWLENEYTPFGKWMDGWESRRRRTEGHDWCIIALGIPGIIKAIEVDTAYFTGNFSPKVSILGANFNSETPDMEHLTSLRTQSILDRPEHGRMGLAASEEEFELVERLESSEWKVLVPLTALGAGYEETRHNLFRIPFGEGIGGPVSHIRLNMGPDGGIARIRVFGEVIISPESIPIDHDIDLASVMNGGSAIGCSNKHYGHPRNLIAPGRGTCMGDGWETARQPARPPVYMKGEDGLMILPGCDWAMLKLGIVGVASIVEVDTNFYKGNYPESCMIQACHLPAGTIVRSENDSELPWKELLPRVRLTPNAQHFFHLHDGTLREVGPISHLKLTIYPDGGVMRLRVIGRKHNESKL